MDVVADALLLVTYSVSSSFTTPGGRGAVWPMGRGSSWSAGAVCPPVRAPRVRIHGHICARVCVELPCVRSFFIFNSRLFQGWRGNLKEGALPCYNGRGNTVSINKRPRYCNKNLD